MNNWQLWINCLNSSLFLENSFGGFSLTLVFFLFESVMTMSGILSGFGLSFCLLKWSKLSTKVAKEFWFSGLGRFLKSGGKVKDSSSVGSNPKILWLRSSMLWSDGVDGSGYSVEWYPSLLDVEFFNPNVPLCEGGILVLSDVNGVFQLYNVCLFCVSVLDVFHFCSKKVIVLGN